MACRLFQFHSQRNRVKGPDAHAVWIGYLATVESPSPLDVVQEVGIPRSGDRIKCPAPGIRKVLRRHRGAIAPAHVVPQVEDVLAPTFQDLPGSGHVGHDVQLRARVHQTAEELTDYGSGKKLAGPDRIQSHRLELPRPKRVGRRLQGGRLHLPGPLPQGKALLVGLARLLKVEGGVIGQPQLHQRPRRPPVLSPLLQKGQRSPVVVNRLLVGVGQAGLVARARRVIGGLLSFSRLGIVARQLGGDAFGLVSIEFFQRCRDFAVQQPPFTSAEPAVEISLEQRMRELVVRQEPALYQHLLPFSHQPMTGPQLLG